MSIQVRGWILAAATVFCFASVGCSGCNKMVDDAMNTPENRQNVIAKTTASCVAAATKNAPADKQTPDMQSKVNTYCSCVSNQFMATLPGSDMIKIAIHGIDSLQPDQKAKLESTIKACKAEAYGGSAEPAETPVDK
jgi:hypothetical protein